jgi:GAF domain-containing protein
MSAAVSRLMLMTTGTTGELAAQLDQVRLESDTLYGVIGVIASSPDLDRVLDGVIDVLTNATSCHACFVYLRRGERLRLRAASRVYAHLVGRVEFPVGEGLAGWVMQRNAPAFIRENALEDPRTNFVPELEEQRFQSMVAVPIPTRGGDAMGVIVLHTIAPREFDERTLNLLAHAAPLVAGAIENAQLYEDARRRVAALTSLSALSQRIAAVDDRAGLYREASAGVRALLGCDTARLYEMDGDRRRLELVAADPPPITPPAAHASATSVLLELLQQRSRHDDASMRRVREALELDAGAAHVLVVPVAAGDEHAGVLVAAGVRPLPDEGEELLRAIANQIAVALKKAELIERLTEENIARDLLTALEEGRDADARSRARHARCDLDRVHVFVHVVDAGRAGSDPDDAPWPERAERAEAALRRLVPGALCDAGSDRVRALLPLAGGATPRELTALDAVLAELGSDNGLALGRSDPHRGADEGDQGLREAADAARVSVALSEGGGMLAYRELGAYRYLVHLLGEETPGDPYLDAVRTIAAYDRRRGSQLVMTLEQYLADRRSVTETARALTVHPNTLRQRLDRIETLTGLELATADLLALELAVKLARLQTRG